MKTVDTVDPQDVLHIVMELTGVSHLIYELISSYPGDDSEDWIPVMRLSEHQDWKVFKVVNWIGPFPAEPPAPVVCYLGETGYVDRIEDAVALSDLRKRQLNNTARIDDRPDPAPHDSVDDLIAAMQQKGNREI